MGRAFEYRKHKKFARWSAMAKNFTKLSKQVMLAVKSGGPDPATNYKLKVAIQNAKSMQMPKENVENAIKKAMSTESVAFSELAYEGYASHGIAVYVEAATDNPTRTVANVRLSFSKCGGQLGNSGSLSFLFDKMSMFKFPLNDLDRDELELDLIDFGLTDLEIDDDEDGNKHATVYTTFTDFDKMNKHLESIGIEPEEAKSVFVPNDYKEVTDEQAEDVIKLIERLEEDDDVLAVYTNMK